LVAPGVFAIAMLVGCSGSHEAHQPTARVVDIAGPNGRLKVQIPPGRPPKDLVVKDLREGTGPAVEKEKDEIIVKYAGLEFDSGHQFYNSWDLGGPSKFLLEETHPGWEIGLKGMKAGGLRQLITPPRMEYGTTTLIYVIEMVKVRHARS
jgi:peptidylprolyl isomerase